MKVYVVFTGLDTYYPPSVEGIFSSEEGAEDYLNTLEDIGWVEPYELDNPDS